MPMMLGPVPGNVHERIVYRALREQLPDDWWVVSDVTWTQREADVGDQAYVRDGQADFVVLAPALGLLVLEVKGSKFVRVASDGCWYRSADGATWELIEKQTPPEQAIDNAHKITRRVAVNLRLGTFRFPFGYIVAYPQGAILEGGFEMFDSSTIVLKQHMSDLRARIRGALQARASEFKAQQFTADMARDVARSLVNEGLLVGPAPESELVSASRTEAEKIEQLTRQQAAALQGIFRYPRVAITGPAGSGKTVLAIWRLVSLVEQGAQAIYLCFNKALADFLRIRNPSVARAIHHVDSYFGSLVRHVSRRADEEVDRFFAEELPGHVIDEVSQWPDEKKLDAIVVDEGQDFGELRLWAAQELLRPDGSFLYCSDDRQDLYDRNARKAVGAEIVFSLVHNCRNTTRITETSNRVVDEHVAPMPGLPEGLPTEIRAVVDRLAMAKVAWELASRWSTDGGRVAILSPYRFQNSAMSLKPAGHNKRLVQSVAEWEASDAVLFSTIKSFKGLEADAVVVVDVDVPHENGALQRSDLYVACTRGRARLALLCVSEAARSSMTASTKSAP